jgi:hypothetical protein
VIWRNAATAKAVRTMARNTAFKKFAFRGICLSGAKT